MQKHSTTEHETLFPLEPIEELDRNRPPKLSRLRQKLGCKADQAAAEGLQESRMREIRTSGLMGGRQSPCKA